MSKSYTADLFEKTELHEYCMWKRTAKIESNKNSNKNKWKIHSSYDKDYKTRLLINIIL
jgi:hypothetical protein